MKSEKKISVIVPTYNRCLYLKETIESILKQDYSNFEIIITDNNSTDATAEVVKSFNDVRIKYFKNEVNVGSVKNYNVALSQATGDYIHFFSDDDIMNSCALAKKASILDRYEDIGVVHSNILVIDQVGKQSYHQHYIFKIYKKWAKIHDKSKAFNNNYYHKLLHIDNLICMPAVLFRKKILQEIGLLDDKLSYIVDWQYWLKITLFYNVYYINEKLVSYRIHESNTVKLMSKDVWTAELDYIHADLKNKYAEKLLLKKTLSKKLFAIGFKITDLGSYANRIKKIMSNLKKN